MLRRAVIACIAGLTLLSGCGPQRAPVPPGVVPEQRYVSAEDEQYGHEVFSLLTQRFPLDTDDSRINRVRAIVDRLSSAAHADQNPWHIYVLRDDSFKNAAATRGNYLFVWTGMLRSVQNDEELAAIVAHEMGHVLAGHTKPTPMEEVNQAMAGVGGSIAGQVISAQGYGAVGDLAGIVVEQAIKAFIVNPEEQRKELEADQVGLFLMADGGYNPTRAVEFWERVKTDPDFAGMSSLQFLSSHPTSEARVERLRSLLPEAEERFRSSGHPTSEWDWSGGATPSNKSKPARSHTARPVERRGPVITGSEQVWEVASPSVNVYDRPVVSSPILGRLRTGTQVIIEGPLIRNTDGSWLQITNPMGGFVQSRHLAPIPQDY